MNTFLEENEEFKSTIEFMEKENKKLKSLANLRDMEINRVKKKLKEQLKVSKNNKCLYTFLVLLH